MDIKIRWYNIELFADDEHDYIHRYPDILLGLRIIVDEYTPSCLVYRNNFNDLLALFCGGRPDSFSNGYRFNNRRALNHFEALQKGFNNVTQNFDPGTKTPCWYKVDPLDDIPW